ncbi:MAG: preprotein translocase subunit YajC [Neisseria sp.]|nr:preprotein translocase subunit YajC [Neisseria sp.]
MIEFAHAAGEVQQQQGILSYVPIILLIIVFYFLIIRPQQKRVKAHQDMVAALQVGDKVVLSSGIVGKITKAGDKFFTVEIARNVEVQVERYAVANKVAAEEKAAEKTA